MNSSPNLDRSTAAAEAVCFLTEPLPQASKACSTRSGHRAIAEERLP